MPIPIGALRERASDNARMSPRIGGTGGTGLLAALLAAALLTGCGGGPAEPTTMPATDAAAANGGIRGALAYRARIALPKQALAIVELRGESGADGAVVAEQRIELNGKQVPVPFELIVDRSTLTGKPPYQVRGGIVVSGRPEWSTALVVIDEAVDSVDLGTLLMNAARTGTVTTTLRCGEQTVIARFDPGAAQMTLGTETYALREARTSAGTRYVSTDNPNTALWNESDQTRVKLKGRTLPVCASAADENAASMRATGNEPGWRLELGAATLSFATAEGNRSIEAPTPLPRVISPDQRRYSARIGSRDMTIDIAERVCVDSMTGMPHPQAVRIRFSGKTYSGCGGDPATLLQGTEWRVQDIDGALVPRSRATLSFADEGRVTGRASCNAFGAEYSLTGERLVINRAAATMMACDAALMQQEKQFLDLLQKTERFEITADGALVLHSAGQRSITARRGL
jgi:heat shock protein HslJ/uncharacterized lipoprotein YbaY